MIGVQRCGLYIRLSTKVPTDCFGSSQSEEFSESRRLSHQVSTAE